MITVGVDEVGRGCWAGPLVAGAVILRGKIPGLKDSKLLKRAQREKLAIQIERRAVAFGLGWVTPSQIDELGLTEATRLAMDQAIGQILTQYDEIIVDGNYNYLPNAKSSRALVNADNLVPAVSAASIIAKVARDNFMYEQAKLYPFYEFDKHVGYGTKLHRELLSLHGISAIHRKSYEPVRKIMEAAT